MSPREISELLCPHDAGTSRIWTSHFESPGHRNPPLPPTIREPSYDSNTLHRHSLHPEPFPAVHSQETWNLDHAFPFEFPAKNPAPTRPFDKPNTGARGYRDCLWRRHQFPPNAYNSVGKPAAGPIPLEMGQAMPNNSSNSGTV